MIEPTSKIIIIVNENDDIEELNTIEVFYKNNQLIDAATIISRDLVCIKCYVIYYKHFMSKWHGITLKLVVVRKKYPTIYILAIYMTYHLLPFFFC
jgi:hypothetical protein